MGVHGESRRPGAIWIDRLVSSAATPDRQGSRAVFAMPRWTSRSSASRVTLSLAPFFMVLLFVRNVCSNNGGGAGHGGGPCRCRCIGSWGECGVDCRQTYTITRQKTSPEGKDCPHSDGFSRDCDGGQCVPPAVNCQGSWSACDASCTQSYTITKKAENGGAPCSVSDGAKKNCSEDHCPSSYVPSPSHVSVAHLYVNPRLAGIKVEPFTLSDGTRSNRSNVTRRDLANVEGGETLTLRGRGRIEAPIPTPPGSEFYSFLPTTLVQICNPIGVCFDASTRVADDKMSLRLSVPSYSDLCADRDGRPACVENVCTWRFT